MKDIRQLKVRIISITLHACRTQQRLILCFALCLGLVLRVGFCQRPALVHPDEIFQQLEPAHRLAFGYGIVTWEWRDGIRSWVLPSLFGLIIKTAAFLHDDPSFYLTFVKIVLSLASLAVIWAAYAWAVRLGGKEAAAISAIGTAVWHQLVVYASHSLSEVVATDLLLPGSYLLLYSVEHSYQQLLGGFFCGLAFALRMQLAPIFIVAASIAIFHSSKKGRPLLIASLFGPFVIFGLIDWVSLGLPFQSYWKYAWVNVIAGASQRYGISPWYGYLIILVQRYGPLLLVAIIGARKSRILTSFCVIEVLFMSMVAHKEDRFIYPIAPFVIVLSVLGIVELSRIVAERWNFKMTPSDLIAFGGILILASSVALWPNYAFRRDGANAMADMKRLSRDHDMCGLEIRDVPWFLTGGYTYLHKNVPMSIRTAEDPMDDPGANFMIFPKGNELPTTAYKTDFCEGEVCAYRKPGPCGSFVPHELNQFLHDTGN